MRHLLRWELQRAGRSVAVLLLLLGVSSTVVLRDQWGQLVQALPLLNVLAAALSAALVLQGDTPLIPTRFVGGKPIPRIALLSAKLVAAVVLFLLLPLGAMAATLLAAHAPADAIARDLAAATLNLSVVVTAFMAMGALTANVRQLFAAIAGGVLIDVVVGWINQNLALRHMPTEPWSIGLSALAVCVAYLWRTSRRVAFLAATSVAGCLILALLSSISPGWRDPDVSATIRATVDSASIQPDGLVRVAVRLVGEARGTRFTPFMGASSLEGGTRDAPRLRIAEMVTPNAPASVRARWREVERLNARGERTRVSELTVDDPRGESISAYAEVTTARPTITVTEGSSSVSMSVPDSTTPLEIPSTPVFDSSAVFVAAPSRRLTSISADSITVSLHLRPLTLSDSIRVRWAEGVVWNAGGERLTLAHDTTTRERRWWLSWSTAASGVALLELGAPPSPISWAEIDALLPGERIWRHASVGGARIVDGSAVLPGSSRQRATHRVSIAGVRDIPAGTQMRIRMWLPAPAIRVESAPVAR